jgi:hypothetical protein
MKTKKYLAALLALVMLLSILPMAAFAASCDHTYVVSSDTLYRKYNGANVDNSTYHDYRYANTRTCTICGSATTTYTAWTKEKHYAVTKVRTDSGSEEGEEYNVYWCTCACGYGFEITEWGYTG